MDQYPLLSNLSSRWEVTEKQDHDGMKVKTKAGLVVIGFQEAEEE